MSKKLDKKSKKRKLEETIETAEGVAEQFRKKHKNDPEVIKEFEKLNAKYQRENLIKFLLRGTKKSVSKSWETKNIETIVNEIFDILSAKNELEPIMNFLQNLETHEKELKYEIRSLLERRHQKTKNLPMSDSILKKLEQMYQKVIQKEQVEIVEFLTIGGIQKWDYDFCISTDILEYSFHFLDLKEVFAIMPVNKFFYHAGWKNVYAKFFCKDWPGKECFDTFKSLKITTSKKDRYCAIQWTPVYCIAKLHVQNLLKNPSTIDLIKPFCLEFAGKVAKRTTLEFFVSYHELKLYDFLITSVLTKSYLDEHALTADLDIRYGLSYFHGKPCLLKPRVLNLSDWLHPDNFNHSVNIDFFKRALALQFYLDMSVPSEENTFDNVKRIDLKCIRRAGCSLKEFENFLGVERGPDWAIRFHKQYPALKKLNLLYQSETIDESFIVKWTTCSHETPLENLKACSFQPYDKMKSMFKLVGIEFDFLMYIRNEFVHHPIGTD